MEHRARARRNLSRNSESGRSVSEQVGCPSGQALHSLRESGNKPQGRPADGWIGNVWWDSSQGTGVQAPGRTAEECQVQMKN